MFIDCHFCKQIKNEPKKTGVLPRLPLGQCGNGAESANRRPGRQTRSAAPAGITGRAHSIPVRSIPSSSVRAASQTSRRQASSKGLFSPAARSSSVKVILPPRSVYCR